MSERTPDPQPSLFATVPLPEEPVQPAVEVLKRWRPGEAVSDLPSGMQGYWGVPFTCAQDWLVAGTGIPSRVPVPAGSERGLSHLVVLHACTTPAGEPDRDPIQEVVPAAQAQLGVEVANYVLEYADGTEHRQPVRWRYEIDGLPSGRSFGARPLGQTVPLDFRGPMPRNQWGRWQTSVGGNAAPDLGFTVYALRNPHPERPLRALRIEAAGGFEVALAAVTAFAGQEHPLRHERLQSFRVTLPEHLVSAPEPVAAGSSGLMGDWRPQPQPDLSHVPVELDLGVIARKYAVPAFDPDAWLAGEGISRPYPAAVPAEPLREILLDLAASKDATLTVGETAVPLRGVFESGTAASADGGTRVEVLGQQKAWLHVTVEDGPDGRPIPSRVHFRAPDGRYLPPYGHRHEVNENWFEDYGADLKLHETQYAYVDGTFQVELPTGDVYVELFKGFEYQPLRQRLSIAPGQRALTLRPERALDWSARGWMTADTHVHFISPQTAWLQGRAEGLNLVNLLASQWGDLYTNVGDISGSLSGVSRDGTLVWVGTENRQHLLGHMSLLGIKGEPVFPMTTAGPQESYIGDPTWTTLAEWADEARRKEGVVVIPHFPNPYAEVAADIVLDKIDAVEINMQNWPLHVYEWYRYLNCGYRVAAVGGTDKMSAQMPVGAIRTYARLEPGQPFTFDAWGNAVRAGRTFTTTGPLVDLTVEGRHPGDELSLPAGGGTLHVSALAESVVPFTGLEIMVNGQVVAAQRSEHGTYRCQIEQPVHVPGSAWVAARVTSGMHGWVGSPRVVAAHTTPVYVVAGGQELFSPSDATFMLRVVEGGLLWMDTLATRADPERHARNRRVFEQARDRLHARLHAHGHDHDHGGGQPHQAGHTH